MNVYMQDKVLEARPAGVHTLRRAMHTALPLAGLGLICSVALFRQELRDAAFIVLGICLIEVGISKLAHKLLPEQRKYHALRAHADQFLMLVRQLNTAALRVKTDDTPGNRRTVEAISLKMHGLVDRMACVGGKTNADLITEAMHERQKDFNNITNSNGVLSAP
jgi:hypothetical protein